MRDPATALAILALTAGSQAQMATNSICPDFVTIDINGNQHHLYDYLDQGYTVYIDRAATWCMGSWLYHDTQTLADFYTNYGPGSSADRAMVFMVEIDPNTHLAELYGSGMTQGDWITDTPYPIIDDHVVGELLYSAVLPDWFAICPDRRFVTLPYAPTEAQLVAALDACPLAVLSHDAALLPFAVPDVPMGDDPDIDKVCPGVDVLLHVRLSNMGTAPLTAATLQASIDGNIVSTYNWSGDLQTYAFEDVGLTWFTPTANSDVLYTITTPDDDLTNNETDNSMAVGELVLQDTYVTMELTTDDVATGTTWWLLDVDGHVIYERPNASLYDANTTYTYQWTLQDGQCYIFRVIDYNGNGLCCDGGNGGFSFSADGQTFPQDASYGYQGYYPFTVNGGVEVPEVAAPGALEVLPNPATDILRVTLPAAPAQPLDLMLTDAVGRSVLNDRVNSSTHLLDLSAQPRGIYLLTLRSAEGIQTRRVVLE